MTEQVNQVIGESGKHQKRGVHHQRSRDHLVGVYSNDKENQDQPAGTQIRKINVRGSSGNAQGEVASLNSISVNLSPPQRQYRGQKFINRRNSGAKQQSTDMKKAYSPPVPIG